MIETCTVLYSSHWPCLATEHVKCSQSELKCAVSVTCTAEFEDLVQKKKKKKKEV